MDHRQSLRQGMNSQAAALPHHDADRRHQSALGRPHASKPADPRLSTGRRPIFSPSNVSSTADSERSTNKVSGVAFGEGGVSFTISRDSSADEWVRQAKLLADMGERSKKIYNGNNMESTSAEPETYVGDADEDRYTIDEKGETKAKVAEEAKKVAEQASKAAGDDKEPIKFKDALGRKFNFPWNICAKWIDMEDLINQAFAHVDVLGPDVREGHYDLIGPDGEIVLPVVWEKTVQPGWQITMRMWPQHPPPLPGPPAPPAPDPHGLMSPMQRPPFEMMRRQGRMPR